MSPAEIKLPPAYQILTPELKEKAIAQIDKQRADMPKVYRSIYDKAIFGNSLRAAVKSFCLQCCMWERQEVRICSSTACSLWGYRGYRPYQLSDLDVVSGSENPAEKTDFDTESTKLEQSKV